MRALGIALVVSACVQSKALICKDGHLCPSDQVCDDVHGGCVVSEQITACAGVADAMMCSYRDEPIGFCKDGVCFASTCGDGIVTAPEQCEAGVASDVSCSDFGFYEPAGLTCEPMTCEYDTSQCQGSCGDRGQHLLNGGEVCDGSPPAETCLDLGFEMGVIGCTGQCGPDLSGCRDLHLVTSAGVGSADVAGMWAASPSRVFAVGAGGAIQSFDGTKWSAMSSGTTANLADVWGSSESDVYAIGAAGALLHFDGSTWTAVASGTAVDLWGVWGTSASDVFVVGDGGTILHYDGTSWSAMTSGTAGTLHAVWGSGPSDVYAVGSLSTNILHYDGTWTAQPVLPVGGNFNDIWGSAADDIYVVGVNSGRTPTILHLGAGGWADVSPTPRPFGALHSVWGANAQDVFAVDDDGDVMHYGGVAWRTLARVPRILSAVGGADSSHVWIGGDTGTLFGFGGTAAIAQPMAAAAESRGVAARSNGEIFVVGDEVNGSTAHDQIHHFKNGVWTTEVSGIAGALRGVWFPSATTAIAVGKGDTVHDMVSYSGSTGLWSVLASSPGTDLHAVWGMGTQAFAVGAGGVLLRTQNGGGTWTPSTVGGSTWEAVWGASISDVFAVGTSGTIAHFDGVFWTMMTSPTSDALNAVSGTTGSDVYAAGAKGTLLHYDGASWTVVPVPVTTDLLAVWNGPGDDLFISGYTGVFLHRVAGTWLPLDASTVLTAIAISGAGKSIYVVGATPSLLELYRTTIDAGPETACDNYWDDDGNGLIDACDPACAGRGPQERCANGFDDDCDGLVDCADPDCAHDPACN